MIRFFCGETRNENWADKYDEGIGCKLVHLLRDFIEDFSQGYVNISQDDIERYRINLDNINDDKFRAWVKDKVGLAKKYFRKGKRNLSNSRHLRYKIATYLYCAKYEDVLTRIEKDNYHLRLVYKRTTREKAQFLYKLVAVILSTLKEHYLHKLIRRPSLNSGDDV
jgi:phytoene/squalene synthetase